MKRFTNYFVAISFAAAALFGFNSCEEVEEEVNATANPTVSSVSVDESSITASGATVSVEFADATAINYSVYLLDGAADSFSAVTVTVDATSTSFDLSGLEAETSYTVEVYATSGDLTSSSVTAEFTTIAAATEPDVPAETADPTISLAAVDGATAGSAKFTASVAGATAYSYAYYLASEAEGVDYATLSWVDTTIAADGDYSIIIVDTPADYIIAAYASSADAQSEVVTAEFSIEAASYITVGEASVAALMITMDIEVDLDLCDGYSWYVSNTSWYNGSYAESDLAGGWGTLITENGTFTMGSDYYLSANTAYTLDLLPYSYDEATSTYTMLDHLVYEFTTSGYTLGQSDVSVTIEIDESATSLTSLSATIYNSDSVSGFFTGYVATADVADLETYISESYMTNYPYAQKFYGYSWNDGGYVDSPTKTTTASYLSADTEYTFFAIAVDNAGFLGQISSASASTQSLSVDPDLKPTVTINAAETTAEFTFEFGDCYKVFYYNVTSGNTWYTEDTIYSYFLGDLTSLYYGWSKDSGLDWYGYGYDATTDSVVYTQTYLQMGTDYILYYMGVKEDGTLGNMYSIEYSTKSPTFTSDATLTVEVAESQAYYEAGWEQYPWLEVSFNVTMGAGTDSYLWGYYDIYNVTNTDSMEAFGTALLSSYYCWQLYENATTETKSIYYDTYVFVFIPKDADGNNGMPIVYNPADNGLWDNLVEWVAGSTGGDVMPL